MSGTDDLQYYHIYSNSKRLFALLCLISHHRVGMKTGHKMAVMLQKVNKDRSCVIHHG